MRDVHAGEIDRAFGLQFLGAGAGKPQGGARLSLAGDASDYRRAFGHQLERWVGHITWPAKKKGGPLGLPFSVLDLGLRSLGGQVPWGSGPMPPPTSPVGFGLPLVGTDDCGGSFSTGSGSP